MAIFLGLATGVIHATWVAVRQVGFDLMAWQPRGFYWMLPVGYVTLFVLVAVPLALLRLVMPRGSGRGPAFVLAFLAALSIALLVPRLHSVALLLLSGGAAARLALVLASESHGARRVIRGGTALLMALTLTAYLAIGSVSTLRARAAVRALPPAAAAAPNVLFIILDTVRAASMSFLGYPRETTPRLARRGAEGAMFGWAFSPSSWTLESHASFFTGRIPRELSASWTRPLDVSRPTVTELFAARGYRTGAFVANHLYAGHHTGLGRGFQRFDDYGSSIKQILLGTTLLQTPMFWGLRHAKGPRDALRALARLELRWNVPFAERKHAPDVAREFLAWQRESGDRPFFAFLNYYDAHEPYEPPDEFRRRFAATPSDLDRYDGAIAYLDREVGAILDSLEAEGVLDRTIVVITSDHGEAFDGPATGGHGKSLSLAELHVPLLIRYPPVVPPATRVGAAVTLRELPATLLDLAGIGTRELPGRSLARYWNTAGGADEGGPVIAQIAKGINVSPDLPVSRGDMSSVLDNRWHYILNGDGVEEIFEYRVDRLETRNLVATDSGRAALARLREQLRRYAEEADGSRPPP